MCMSQKNSLRWFSLLVIAESRYFAYHVMSNDANLYVTDSKTSNRHKMTTPTFLKYACGWCCTSHIAQLQVVRSSFMGIFQSFCSISFLVTNTRAVPYAPVWYSSKHWVDQKNLSLPICCERPTDAWQSSLEREDSKSLFANRTKIKRDLAFQSWKRWVDQNQARHKTHIMVEGMMT